MKLKVLVVDDEALARTRMRTLLADCGMPGVEWGGEAANAVEAMEWLRRDCFDLVLLDIHMPGVDGMALARAIQAQPQAPIIVFVTAHAEHAVQAFELEAADYLTKPVRRERLQMALQKVDRAVQSARETQGGKASEVVLIQDRGRTERVPLSEVLYFKAELKYITVRTLTHSYILDGALNDLEVRYGDAFMRVHRNALVLRSALRALEKHHDPEEGEGWAVRLNGVDDLLAVSRRQLAAVREALAE
jgi:two-component system response regulator AlgR